MTDIPELTDEQELQALTDLMLAKNRYAIRRTKFVLNDREGIKKFSDKTDGWFDIRGHSRTFWDDQRR